MLNRKNGREERDGNDGVTHDSSSSQCCLHISKLICFHFFVRCIQMLLVMCNPLQVRIFMQGKELSYSMKDKLYAGGTCSVSKPVHDAVCVCLCVCMLTAGTRCGWGQLQRACGEPDAGARHHESATPPGLPALQPHQRQTRAGDRTQDQRARRRRRQIW